MQYDLVVVGAGPAARAAIRPKQLNTTSACAAREGPEAAALLSACHGSARVRRADPDVRKMALR